MVSKIYLPIVLIFLYFSLSSVALGKDDIGSVYFGFDYLPNNQYNETRAGEYDLRKSGFQFGFGIPLNFPLLDYTYRIGMTVHDIQDRTWGRRSVYDYPDMHLYDVHSSAVNELLIGKSIHVMPKFKILPQLGFGIQFDALYQNDESTYGGIVYNCLFLDLSNELRYTFKSFGMGIRVNYLFSIHESTVVYEATNRLQVSCLIFK